MDEKGLLFGHLFFSLEWFFFIRSYFDITHIYVLFQLQEAVARLEEIKKSIEGKMALRQTNLNPERPG